MDLHDYLQKRRVSVDLPKDIAIVCLNDSKIEILERLEHCECLRNIEARRNGMHAVAPALAMSSLVYTLQKLDLSDNQLTSSCLKVIGHFEALEDLNLSHNRITSFPKKYSMKNLTSLIDCDLSHNKISVIENIDGMTALTHLNLSHNEISMIKCDRNPSDTDPKIKNLDLSYNQIKSVSVFKRAKKFFRYLSVLDVRSNPLSEGFYQTNLSSIQSALILGERLFYRASMIQLFNTVEFLDTVAVDSSEKESSNKLIATIKAEDKRILGKNAPTTIQRKESPEKRLAGERDCSLRVGFVGTTPKPTNRFEKAKELLRIRNEHEVQLREKKAIERARRVKLKNIEQKRQAMERERESHRKLCEAIDRRNYRKLLHEKEQLEKQVDVRRKKYYAEKQPKNTLERMTSTTDLVSNQVEEKAESNGNDASTVAYKLKDLSESVRSKIAMVESILTGRHANSKNSTPISTQTLEQLDSIASEPQTQQVADELQELSNQLSRKLESVQAQLGAVSEKINEESWKSDNNAAASPLASIDNTKQLVLSPSKNIPEELPAEQETPTNSDRNMAEMLEKLESKIGAVERKLEGANSGGDGKMSRESTPEQRTEKFKIDLKEEEQVVLKADDSPFGGNFDEIFSLVNTYQNSKSIDSQGILEDNLEYDTMSEASVPENDAKMVAELMGIPGTNSSSGSSSTSYQNSPCSTESNNNEEESDPLNSSFSKYLKVSLEDKKHDEEKSPVGNNNELSLDENQCTTTQPISFEKSFASPQGSVKDKEEYEDIFSQSTCSENNMDACSENNMDDSITNMTSSPLMSPEAGVAPPSKTEDWGYLMRSKSSIEYELKYVVRESYREFVNSGSKLQQIYRLEDESDEMRVIEECIGAFSKGPFEKEAESTFDRNSIDVSKVMHPSSVKEVLDTKNELALAFVSGDCKVLSHIAHSGGTALASSNSNNVDYYSDITISNHLCHLKEEGNNSDDNQESSRESAFLIMLFSPGVTYYTSMKQSEFPFSNRSMMESLRERGYTSIRFSEDSFYERLSYVPITQSFPVTVPCYLVKYT